jgi:uncharacterized MAPEG superfamily protein
MTTAYWCVLIAGLLPYLATGIAKGGARFDNNDPRAWLARQTGWRARAHSAQQNSFEAFPLFAAAVIVAHLAGTAQPKLDTLAIGFVVARIAYLAAYLLNFALFRTLVWMIGMAIVITIFCSR